MFTGLRLPLQNLWNTEVLPAQMPLSLLPLSQYELTTLVALLTVGGASAGLAIRIWAPERRKLALICTAAGVLVVQLSATVQSFMVLKAGLDGGTRSDLYFAGLLAGVSISIIAAMVALILIASTSRAMTTLGVGLMATPLTSWVSEALVNLLGAASLPATVLMLLRWLPAVLVGAGLAWCGLRSVKFVVVWLVNLVLLWVIPALFITVNYVLGSRVLLSDPQEITSATQQILAAALGPNGGAGPLLILALTIGLAGIGVREVLRRTRKG
nr:hypothetical protein [Paeniglutamicibacter terrestris]